MLRGETMPYDDRTELPEQVKGSLPVHAQRIYQKAFNSAFEQYQDPQDRYGNESREQVAHKVAWSAVKQKYHKEGEAWVRNT